MRLEIKLTQATDETKLSKFISEVHRLSDNKKTFNFACQNSRVGIKLYLYTCKGIQDETYVCVRQKKTLNELVSTLNYAMMLHASVQLSVSNDFLSFNFDKDKNSDIVIKNIMNFAQLIGLKCY